MSEYVFLNGEILESKDAKLQIGDLALLRGYGVFDYFRVIDGKPIFLEDYLDRFERSLAGLQLILPYHREYLKEQIFELIRLNTFPLLGIRLVCTGGFAHDAYTPTTPNAFMIAKPFNFHPYDQGLKLMTAEFQRELHQIKSINYLQPISLLPKMKAFGADDVIYFHNGLVSESSRSNVFIIKNSVLITPDTGILEGITRKKILSFASEILPMEIKPITIEELYRADEVFLSASTKRISPVTSIDEQNYESGPWTKKLYDRLLEEEKK
ncbi:MAG: aminotransferase class IV [Saprospiraceae bacterium]|nr:aminotransferase class IV [Saprospiraceae bacterium]